MYRTLYLIIISDITVQQPTYCADKFEELSDTVNRERTDNTMAKGKRTKGQTTIYKTFHRNLNIEQSEPH
jgi:hypothetical protein